MRIIEYTFENVYELILQTVNPENAKQLQKMWNWAILFFSFLLKIRLAFYVNQLETIQMKYQALFGFVALCLKFHLLITFGNRLISGLTICQA